MMTPNVSGKQRADDAHGGQRDHTDGDLALAASDVGKQLRQMLPAGNVLGRACRLRGDAGDGMGCAAHRSGDSGVPSDCTSVKKRPVVWSTD